jgi:hypothetical protein
MHFILVLPVVPLFLGNKPMDLKQSSGRKMLADWLKPVSLDFAPTTLLQAHGLISQK